MIKRLAAAVALTAAVVTVFLLGGGAHPSRIFPFESASTFANAPTLEESDSIALAHGFDPPPAGLKKDAASANQTIPEQTIPEQPDSLHRGPLSSADSARALEKLSNDIAAIVNLPRESKTGHVGVLVRSLATDKTIYSMNPEAPLTPASNTKVVTTFTALSELGPNYSVRTVVTADARPAHDGIVKGNLYVKGYGDPFLTVNEIDALIDQLVNSGIHQVDGNIVGDGSFFDNKTERTQYSGDADVVEALPPIAALTLSQSVYTVVISSPRTAGEPCNVQTFPHSSGFEIVNETVTASPRPARSTRKSARKRKRHSDLLAPADDNAPRYGDEPAGRYLTTLDGDVTPDQRKPSKKAAATATKRGATSAAHGKSKAPAKSAAVAKSSKNAKGSKSTVAAKSVKGKSAKTTAAAAARASSKRSKATASKTTAAKTTASKTTAAKTTASKTTAAKTTASKATAAKAGTKASIAKSSAAKAPAKSEEAAPVVASRGPIKVSIATAENGKQIITVTGSLPPNRTVSYRYQMKNPPLVIAGMIYDRLRSHGITISGQPTSGVTPAHSRVLAETGRPLAEILHLVMKNSNNFLAEYVFKMIGAAAGGQQETAQKSLEKIQHRMSINHVDFNRCIINDGSGLSRANCLSASALTGILDAAYHDKKIFDAFYPVMSIAGIDGTLRGRMKGTFAQGNVHGKTGTLNNASALSGYVTTRDGEFLCFSMLMNGGNHGAYRAVQDKVAAKLAAFSYAETLASLDK